MNDIWKWRYQQMKEYLENEYYSPEPVESFKPNITQLCQLRATITIIHDMMNKIETQNPPRTGRTKPWSKERHERFRNTMIRRGYWNK